MLQSFTNFLGGTAEQAHTVLFTLFVMFQLFNAFNSRALWGTRVFKGINRNKPMIFVFLLTFALQVIITQFGGAVFGTVPLNLIMWLKIIVTAFSVIVISEIVNLIKQAFDRIKTFSR